MGYSRREFYDFSFSEWLDAVAGYRLVNGLDNIAQPATRADMERFAEHLAPSKSIRVQ